MPPSMLHVIWFVLVGGMFMGYAMLDGFDLGVGALVLFHETDDERRTVLNAIGPVWDGNEVWLVVGGGGLLAAFPEAYATVFSAFYLPFIFLLFALIFRAVSIEFRGKLQSLKWRRVWDFNFGAGSTVSALILGMIIGNLAQGIPLGPDHEFIGSPWAFFNPYAILVGVTTLSLFALHASLYLVLKTEKDLQAKIRNRTKDLFAIFVILYLLTTITTLLYIPHLASAVRANPWIFGVAILNVLALAAIPRALYYKRDGMAFLFSCANIGLLLMLFGLGMFPDLVPSVPHSGWSLTIDNASSTPLTQTILLVVAVVGFPLVLAYTGIVYWVFRGKVKLESHSY